MRQNTPQYNRTGEKVMKESIFIFISVSAFMIPISQCILPSLRFFSRHMSDSGYRKAGFILFTLLVWGGIFTADRFNLIRTHVTEISGTVCLLFAGGLLGAWLSEGINKPAELIPVCIITSLADLVSILHGPTGKIAAEVEAYYHSGMESARPLADSFLIKIPALTSQTMLPLFGVTDWILVIFLTAAAHKTGLNDNLAGIIKHYFTNKCTTHISFPLSFAGLLCAIITAHFSGIFIPGMAFISTIFLSVILFQNNKDWQLTKYEIRLTFIFSIIIISAALVFRVIA
jgi:hypothetical protein